MDREVNTRHNALERILLDVNAEPTDLPLLLLEDVTKCFSEDQQIGSGGFAVVYKGMVGNGIVAVKKLSRTFDMDEKIFHKEIECLIKAKHKNIVRFLGYCSDTQGKMADYEGKLVMADVRNWLLCFEYVPNGSLDKYITDVSRGLEWRERYEIIKGICEGLCHLHGKRILHLDLKPANILIDDHMVPKIADFGISRCLDNEQTRAFTSHLCGSQGYLAPEMYRGELAFASDVYSLGVIIVEILTGEKGCPDDENVAERWMNELKASDQRDTQLEQVRVCIKIGKQCMNMDPKKRPAVRHIVERLDKTASATYSEETAINSSFVALQMKMDVSLLQERGGDRGETSARPSAAIALAPAAALATPIALVSNSHGLFPETELFDEEELQHSVVPNPRKVVPQPPPFPARRTIVPKRVDEKGKEPEEASKQICGICLSEEQRGTLQGLLNCCSHYFCFTCILEWSKAESRCPVCKQRFNKITVADEGSGLTNTAISVGNRDQVYQLSEEEMNPYENIKCIECNQSGDDNLMLLCDLCDSPAHTFCVGLGREVPEGNWYCGGCRSTV